MNTFAEFFAGIGLVRAGLAPGGWQCVYANDIEPKKFEMYRDHFGGASEYHLGDIWNTEEVLGRLPGQFTLATASFPCTDLSLAGNWRGIDGHHSSTFFAFVEILRRLGSERPPLVLVENVTGFLVSNGGADFARATRELADLGYWLDAILVDAKWFVPQSRPRVFLLGVMPPFNTHEIFEGDGGLFAGTRFGDTGDASDPLRPPQLVEATNKARLATGWLRAKMPLPPRRRPELADVLDIDDGQDWWARDLVDKHLEAMQEPSRARLRQLVNLSAYTTGTAFRRTRLGRSRAEVRFDIAGCLRTPRGGSARQIVIRAGRGTIDLRWMTPVEYARLQGIGEFSIRVPTQQALFGFGDAVCVPAVQWIDEHLLTPLAASTQRRLGNGQGGHVLTG